MSAAGTYTFGDYVCDNMALAGTSLGDLPGNNVVLDNLYECMQSSCTAMTPGTMNAKEDADGWFLLRRLGEIVNSFSNNYEAFKYEDYMYTLKNDIVYIGNDLFKCLDSDMCSNFTPDEDFTSTIW